MRVHSQQASLERPEGHCSSFHSSVGSPSLAGWLVWVFYVGECAAHLVTGQQLHAGVASSLHIILYFVLIRDKADATKLIVQGLHRQGMTPAGMTPAFLVPVSGTRLPDPIYGQHKFCAVVK
jgi:hypothetical protein